jgi:hypothetical protein
LTATVAVPVPIIAPSANSVAAESFAVTVTSSVVRARMLHPVKSIAEMQDNLVKCIRASA